MKIRSLCVVGLCFFLMVGCMFLESDFDKLERTKNCAKCDLSGANLSGANLSGADLTEAELTGASLTGANLTRTIFCETEMTDGTMNNSGC